MSLCTKCGVVLTAENRKKTRSWNVCNDCYRRWDRENYRKHRDKRRASMRRWYRERGGKERMIDWQRKNQISLGNGKRIRVKNKRPRPDDQCEMCGRLTKGKRLDYHHWVSEKPEIGMWLCKGCHFFAERIENEDHIRYIRLKKRIEQESKS